MPVGEGFNPKGGWEMASRLSILGQSNTYVHVGRRCFFKCAAHVYNIVPLRRIRTKGQIFEHSSLRHKVCKTKTVHTGRDLNEFQYNNKKTL